MAAALLRGGHPGFGIVCGEPSGNFEALDVEARAMGERWQRVLERARRRGTFDLLARVLAGYSETTLSGGLHTCWRCPDGVEGNLKLAQTPGPAGPDVLLETRSAGGFCVVAPSPGYTVQSGSVDTIAVITADERAALLALFRAADELPPTTVGQPIRMASVDHNGDRPGDKYNATHSWAHVLEPHGWTYLGVGGKGEDLWRRPGKTDGVSATT